MFVVTYGSPPIVNLGSIPLAADHAERSSLNSTTSSRGMRSLVAGMEHSGLRNGTIIAQPVRCEKPRSGRGLMYYTRVQAAVAT